MRVHREAGGACFRPNMRRAGSAHAGMQERIVVKVYATEGGEVRSWASIIDEKTVAQACSISRAPIVDGYLALMPDAHFGYGPPVGTALKTRGGVMPYAVGVDIGCGMIAVKTDLDRDRLRGREGEVLGNIRELIPSGVGKRHDVPLPASKAFLDDYGLPPGLKKAGVAGLEQRLRYQFGTLGAGNHFVEVCESTEGDVWLLLHSGSRGVGNILATYHAKRARKFCDDHGLSSDLESWEFSYFPDPEAPPYLGDMLWCQAYAFRQREAMMDGLIEAVDRVVDGEWNASERINCHHNYAEEIEGGWLTRKGAIDASVDKLGVIPGSMGAATYIVKGLGNEEAYNTSPHGAGRVMGRKQAHRTLDLEAFKKQMAGKTWLDRSAKALLDEAPSAYKPIEQVIEDSADLITPVTVLSQFINYKGL